MTIARPIPAEAQQFECSECGYVTDDIKSTVQGGETICPACGCGAEESFEKVTT